MMISAFTFTLRRDSKVGADLRAARQKPCAPSARPEVGPNLALWRRIAVLAWLLPLAAFAATPALTEVKVFPADVNLKTRQDRQGIVVQAIYADGVTRDVTAQAACTVARP